jgi:hypothetical protein
VGLFLLGHDFERWPSRLVATAAAECLSNGKSRSQKTALSLPAEFATSFAAVAIADFMSTRPPKELDGGILSLYFCNRFSDFCLRGGF